jgi:hypothetical protein
MTASILCNSYILPLEQRENEYDLPETCCEQCQRHFCQDCFPLDMTCIDTWGDGNYLNCVLREPKASETKIDGIMTAQAAAA